MRTVTFSMQMAVVDQIQFHGAGTPRSMTGRGVECATCGATGELTDDLSIRWTNLTRSMISMDKKRAHYEEIRDTAQQHATRRDEIEARRRVRRVRSADSAVSGRHGVGHQAQLSWSARRPCWRSRGIAQGEASAPGATPR